MMRRFYKLLCLCLSVSLLFCGCQKSAAETPLGPDLVTRISVVYHHKNTHLHRIYTDTQKMDVILYYFYSLTTHGKAEKDPELYEGERCRITMTLSSGETHIYRQFGTEYLSVDHKPWQKINKDKDKLDNF